MTIEILMPLFLASLVLILKPGPHMMTMVSLASAGRLRSIAFFWSGYIVGSSLLYYFFLTTLTLLPQGFGLIFLFLKGIAAIIFVSMGLSGLKENVADYQDGTQERREKITKASIAAKLGLGFMLAISNPYDIVFIVTIIPTLLDQTSFSMMDITVIRGVVILADFLVTSSYCIPILMIRNFLNDNILKYLKTFSSYAMIGIGVYIFINIITHWDLNETNLISSLTHIIGV